MFITLMDGDTPLCYKKFKTLLFTKPFPDWRFDSLSADLSIDQVENKNNAGIIQFRCFIRKFEEGARPMKEFIGPNFSPGARAISYRIRAYIY
jgi:hypothetical protein